MKFGKQLNKLNIVEGRLFLMAGPCVIESKDNCFLIAEKLKEITEKLGITFIFKASYDKANRSSGSSYRGPGIKEGLKILEQVKKKFNVSVVSDVHCKEEFSRVKDVLDIIQIPAFLCRQTDLLISAGETGKIVNVKKGQFMAPWDMKNVADKITSTGNDNIILTERGVCFGYNNLVTDMRSIIIMQDLGFPVVFDATHSVQMPGGAGSCSSGDRKYAGPLALAACAVGCNGLFFEVHNDPDNALCDGPNMIALDEIEGILKKAVEIVASI
ncbi:3-deoxy-8-phosphooctulonate synthase [bacterium]|nr:3-deoxy-8-phosphooctulonate synthase [bacterium]